LNEQLTARMFSSGRRHTNRQIDGPRIGVTGFKACCLPPLTHVTLSRGGAGFSWPQTTSVLYRWHLR